VSLEVVEVARGWQPTGIDGVAVPVQPGLDVITLLVQLTNRAGEARYIGDSDLVLVGSDGTRHAARPTPIAREPRLLTMPIIAGDVVRGWQTYVIPSGTTITRAQWNPTRPDRGPAETAFPIDLPR